MVILVSVLCIYSDISVILDSSLLLCYVINFINDIAQYMLYSIKKRSMNLNLNIYFNSTSTREK